MRERYKKKKKNTERKKKRYSNQLKLTCFVTNITEI